MKKNAKVSLIIVQLVVLLFFTFLLVYPTMAENRSEYGWKVSWLAALSPSLLEGNRFEVVPPFRDASLNIYLEPLNLQNTSTEWIIWETAYSPQSLLRATDEIWIGSNGGRLYQWDTETGYYTLYTAEDGLVGDDIVALAFNGSGSKLVAAVDGGLSIGNTTFTNLTPPNGQHAWDLAGENSSNNFWLATLGGGVAYYSNSSWAAYTTANSGLPFNDVYAVAVDGNNTLWAGTTGYGIAAFNGTTWTTYTLPITIPHPVTANPMANDAISDIAIDGNNNKWFATDGSGVAVLNTANTAWTLYNTANSGLPNNFVHAITIDGSQRWFGTLGGGVAALDIVSNTWQVYNTTNSPLPDNDVLAIAIDDNGGQWFATYDTGLTFHGSLPAVPPTLNIDPRRAPSYTPGRAKSYYLWLDPATYTWYLAWSGNGENHSFTGSIVANAPITSAVATHFEGSDSFTLDGNTLSISATETISQDIVSFVLDRSATELTLNLKIDGAYRPFNIQIGKNKELPSTAPFRLVPPQPIPPQVTVSANQTITEGQSIYLTGVFTDTDSFTGHDITWDLGDGTTVTGTLALGHSYADNGVYTATLTVTDIHGEVGSDSIVLTVANAAPEVYFYTDPFQPKSNYVVTMTGSLYDPGPADTHTYLWDFGDGITNTTGLTVTHVYAAEGVYTVTLTITDDDGGVGFDSRPVTVVTPPPLTGITLEAESGLVVPGASAHSWLTQTTQTGYTGTAYLQAMPDVGVIYEREELGDSPQLQYAVQITVPTTYRLWVRGMAADAGGDSLLVGVNGQVKANLTGFTGEWGWASQSMSNTQVLLYLTSAGTYTLNLWIREDGLRIDRLLLVSDPEYIPVGDGPAAGFWQGGTGFIPALPTIVVVPLELDRPAALILGDEPSAHYPPANWLL